MIPEWLRLYSVAAIIGGLAGSVGRTILEEIRLSRLIREKLGRYRPRPVRWVRERALSILLGILMAELVALYFIVIWVFSPPILPEGVFP